MQVNNALEHCSSPRFSPSTDKMQARRGGVASQPLCLLRFGLARGIQGVRPTDEERRSPHPRSPDTRPNETRWHTDPPSSALLGRCELTCHDASSTL